MKLTINGELKSLRTTDSSPTLIEIVKLLGHNPKIIVIELNGAIINPKEWSKQIIQADDILEIVTIVGGGDSP
ncbi:sulfur carrier protein ThiS [Prochlorococcus marinus]|uniref:sulfur carrier protein ThiS n=1 Tax=Prochlorococcus marinus TaxID=1219 RepID=UPI0022B3A0C6|nr:sulfur carrier protein ThiS [Prochlorococcus marinus]